MTVPAFKITNYNEPVEEVRHQRASNNTHENEITRNIETCISNLEKNKLSIANDYSTEYLALAFSFASLGEVGRDFFHRVCALCTEKYNYKDVEDQFTNALKTGRGSYSIATFFEMCKAVGVNYFIRDSHINSGSVTNATRIKGEDLHLDESQTTKDGRPLFTNLLEFKYNAANLIPKPIGVITIDGAIISTAGNLTVIAGASKVGKSGLVGAGIAGSIRRKGDIIEEENLLGFTVAFNSENKGVIHIDSEQSRYDHQRLNQQILKRCNREDIPEYYYSFSLQKFTPKELKEATEVIFTKVAEKHNGLHLAIIDGIGDYVASVNDETEGNEVINAFIRLATNFNIPVLLVLHFNPGSEKGRGHIGSHLERKCESFLSIEKVKDSDISVVKPKLLRNSGPFDEIQFEYNKEKGFHTMIARVNKAAVAEEKKGLIFIKKKDQYNLILNEVFAGKDKIRRKEVTIALKEYFDIKDRGAENRVNEIIDMGLIINQGTLYIRNKDAL